MRVFAPLLLLLLAGCSAPPPANPITPRFLTQINEEGSKRFMLELPDARAGASRQQQSLEMAQLEQLILESGFCRDGFILLSQNSWRIRGECNETATTEDRTTFPNYGKWD